jgi:hypothetical protein
VSARREKHGEGGRASATSPARASLPRRPHSVHEHFLAVRWARCKARDGAGDGSCTARPLEELEQRWLSTGRAMPFPDGTPGFATWGRWRRPAHERCDALLAKRRCGRALASGTRSIGRE